jgi:hypothetical protein
MKLKDARAFYEFFSAKASDIIRQLGFAGIAIIWVFKNSSSETSGLLPREFLWPGVLIVATLASDLLHYLSATLAWGRYSRNKERADVGEEAEFEAPRWINWPSLFFFGLKTLCVIVAYGLLGRVLLNRLF